MEITKAEFRLLDWMSGRANAFVDSLFECMCKASHDDLAKLGEGFPEEVKVFSKFRNQPGYLTDLKARYEMPQSGD